MNRGMKIFLMVVVLSILSSFFVGLLNRGSTGIFGQEALGLLKIEGVIVDVDWYMEQVPDYPVEYPQRLLPLRFHLSPLQHLHYSDD